MRRTSRLLLRGHVRRCPLGRAQLAPTQCGPLHLSARTLCSTAASASAAHTSASSIISNAGTSSSHSSPLLATLDACIAQRKCAQALVTLQEIDSLAAAPSSRPSAQTLQKLAILLAKQKSAVYTQHAYELLLSVYRSPGFRADDYTTLASIYVVDACLHFRLLDEAVETYEEAFNQGVCLDLAAYDALLAALVAADRTFEAVAILNEVADDDAVAPTEHSYLPLLLALARAREYSSAMDLLERGQGRGVMFTGETFNPLVECVEKEEEPTDALVMLLTYIEDIWEDAKLFEALEDQVSEDDDDDNEEGDAGDATDDRESDRTRV